MNFKSYFLLFLFVLPSTILLSQPIYTSTLTGVNNSYSVNTGAYIPSGNTVTIAPNAIVTFNYDLTIKQGAILNMNGATIRMAAGRRIIVEHSTSGTLFGAEFNIDNGSLVTSVSSSPTGGFC